MRQIFVLNRDELTALKNGEPLTMILGDQQITLQGEAPLRRQGNGRNNPPDGSTGRLGIYRRGSDVGGRTITDRVQEYLEAGNIGGVSAISEALDASRMAVASALTRNRGVLYKKRGKGLKAIWRKK